MFKRWSLPDNEDTDRNVQEAQQRLDRTQADDAKVADLLRTTRKKQHDYISEQIARTIRGANG